VFYARPMSKRSIGENPEAAGGGKAWPEASVSTVRRDLKKDGDEYGQRVIA